MSIIIGIDVGGSTTKIVGVKEEGGKHGNDIPEDTDIFHFWGGFCSE